jgi:hypothetical protein
MKTRSAVAFAFAAIFLVSGVASLMAAPLGLGTSFTYQGQLLHDGVPANGRYDFQFRLYDSDGTSVGSPNTVQTVVNVANGLFTVELSFGPDTFAGYERYLEVGVRTSGSAAAYTILNPRQRLTAAPYALYAPAAGNVPWNGISGIPAGLADGTDNDTTYTAGSGLLLAGNQFSVSFAGGGGAPTAARSDHDHAEYVAKQGDTMTGGLTAPRLQAGAPASAACNGPGDVCAADAVAADGNVVAVFDVVAGRDVGALGRVRAGLPASPACNSAGDLCAADAVVADNDVLAGHDVVAQGAVGAVFQLKAGTPTSPSCSGAGAVCADHDVVADDRVLAGTDVLAAGNVMAAGRVRAGSPTNVNCNGAGDVCADDAVVADGAVVAGGDVRAANQVRGGFPSNGACDGVGDVCADDDVVADSQVIAGAIDDTHCGAAGDICAGDDLVADGDVFQGRTGNGLVKAGALAVCTTVSPSILRSFNNVNTATIAISAGAEVGTCTIDFGFEVDDRYITATARDSAAVTRGVTVLDVSGTTADFFRWNQNGSGAGGSIYVLVY